MIERVIALVRGNRLALAGVAMAVALAAIGGYVAFVSPRSATLAGLIAATALAAAALAILAAIVRRMRTLSEQALEFRTRLALAERRFTEIAIRLSAIESASTRAGADADGSNTGT